MGGTRDASKIVMMNGLEWFALSLDCIGEVDDGCVYTNSFSEMSITPFGLYDFGLT